MSNSRVPGPTGAHHHHHRHSASKPTPPLTPARTSGPLGRNDHGDPTVTTLLGWTPNVTGMLDWADPTLHQLEAWGHSALNAIGLHPSTNQPVSVGSTPSAPAAGGLDWEVLKKDYVKWEGKVPWMYLDTKSLVTVGIGRMLPDVAAAQQLPFVRRADGKPASADEIKADFENVKKQPGSQLSVKYKPFTKLDLPDDKIFDLLKTVNDDFQDKLRTHIKGYDAFPVTARRALTDMAYNLGIDGLMKFHNMLASIGKADWSKAATECHRNGPSDERNDWTKSMFLEAAK